MVNRCVVSEEHAPITFFTRKDGQSLYRCRVCGTLMADVEYTSDIYDHDYRNLRAGGWDEIRQSPITHFFRHILKTLTRSTRSRDLFDVGSGIGYFVYLARREFGFDASGMEVSAQQVEYAKRVVGVELEHCRLDELRGRQYSVLSMLGVIEHVEDPLAFLSLAHQHIRPGGHLVLTSPNPTGIAAKSRGLRNWGMIRPPEHINLFPKKPLLEALRITGFTPQHYETLIAEIGPFTALERRLHCKLDAGRSVLRKTISALRLGNTHFVIARKGPLPQVA